MWPRRPQDGSGSLLCGASCGLCINTTGRPGSAIWAGIDAGGAQETIGLIWSLTGMFTAEDGCRLSQDV